MYLRLPGRDADFNLFFFILQDSEGEKSDQELVVDVGEVR